MYTDDKLMIPILITGEFVVQELSEKAVQQEKTQRNTEAEEI